MAAVSVSRRERGREGERERGGGEGRGWGAARSFLQVIAFETLRLSVCDAS